MKNLMKNFITKHFKIVKCSFYALTFLIVLALSGAFFETYNMNIKKNVIVSLILSTIITIVLYKFIKIKPILKVLFDLYENKRLITSLTINDFKTKYAGSYFGIIWAFVQPVCTIAVFWFVFQMGFKSQDVGKFPFILWFVCGLIPWFFFSEAWNSATNCFLEYSYLVKKVVFKINILPLIKILSALLVHLFFVAFMIIMFLVYGIKPDAYAWQLIYYGFCLVCLVLVLSFITAPLVIFFKDLAQIMNIVLQFGMWLTPIMWNIDTMEIPQKLKFVFKLNPVYYIVEGYRDCMLTKTPFYLNVSQTIYFWVVILILAFVAKTIYVKLKPHFADVL